MIAKMLLFAAMLSALLVASRAQVFGQKHRIMSGHLFRLGDSHRNHQRRRRLQLQGVQATPAMFEEAYQADRELLGDLPSSCDADKLESYEYFSKQAECYNAASLEINDGNRDAYIEDSALFSTCYKACRDVYEMAGTSCLKDSSAQYVQVLKKIAADADRNSFPLPDYREAFELVYDAAVRISEALYGILLPSTFDEFLELVDQNAIAETFREGVRVEESLPFGNLGPLTPCVEPNDAMVSEATGSNFLYAVLAFLAILI